MGFQFPACYIRLNCERQCLTFTSHMIREINYTVSSTRGLSPVIGVGLTCLHVQGRLAQAEPF